MNQKGFASLIAMIIIVLGVLADGAALLEIRGAALVTIHWSAFGAAQSMNR